MKNVLNMMPMGPLTMSHDRLTCPGTDAKGYFVHIWDIGSFDTCSMRGSWSSLQEKSDLKLTHSFCGSYLILYIPLVIHLIIFHFYAFLLNRILTSDKANRWNAAAACCASFNTVEVWSARRKSRAVHDTVAHFSHMFNKTTFDLMFYEGEEENQDLNKCCICCSWSGKHKLSLLCSAAVTTAPVLFGMFSQSCCWSTFACFVHSLHLELLHVWKLWRLVHHGHDGNQNRCDFMCILVHAVVWEL